MKPTADFQVEVIENVVVIFDLDRGGRRVTNDIDNVLRVASAHVGGLGRRRVIYRDSTKTFDGVSHQGERFAGFYTVNETVLEAALRKVRGNNVIPLRVHP